MVHVVASDRTTTCFDRETAPVVVVEPGDVVRFETDDSVYARAAAGESLDDIGRDKLNVLTGPVAVRGAAPGDALRIDVLAIEIVRAWTAWLPGYGPLGDRTPELRARQVPVADGRLQIGDGIEVALEPTIGCIGLAPASGTASATSPTYPTGGNMDLRELSPGAMLWLPVEVPGALLWIGDLHAAMGRGEPTYVAIEASGAATVRVDVERGRRLGGPRLRVDDATILIGMGGAVRSSARAVGTAYQSAVDQAFDYLTLERGLDPFTAYAYISARVETRFGGPAGGLALAVVPDPPAERGADASPASTALDPPQPPSTDASRSAPSA